MNLIAIYIRRIFLKTYQRTIDTYITINRSGPWNGYKTLQNCIYRRRINTNGPIPVESQRHHDDIARIGVLTGTLPSVRKQ